MSDPVRCECGAILVEETTSSGVKPIGSREAIVFRRRTDYVICPQCFAVYHARDLLKDEPDEQARPADEDVLEKLARLAEEGGGEP